MPAMSGGKALNIEGEVNALSFEGKQQLAKYWNFLKNGTLI